MASGATVTFFTLHIIGLITLPLLTITFLIPFTKVRRHSTITNFTFVSTLYIIFTCLLLFTKKLTGPEPSSILCEAQASIMFGGPPAQASSVLGLVLKVWHVVWSLDKQRTLTIKNEEATTIVLNLIPYFLWATIAGVSAGLGRGQAYRYTFYCTSANRALGTISGIITAAILFVTCCLHGWSVFIVYKRYKAFNRFRAHEMGGIDVALFTRICVFWGFMAAMLALSLLGAAGSWSSEISDIIAATSYPATFFIFGSQSDVLRAWGIKTWYSTVTESENQRSRIPGELGTTTSAVTAPYGHRVGLVSPKVAGDDTGAGYSSSVDLDIFRKSDVEDIPSDTDTKTVEVV